MVFQWDRHLTDSRVRNTVKDMLTIREEIVCVHGVYVLLT